MALFQVYADGKPILKILPTLTAAKEFAAEHTALDESVHIESFVAPAPSKYWRFDNEVSDWVEGMAPW